MADELLNNSLGNDTPQNSIPSLFDLDTPSLLRPEDTTPQIKPGTSESLKNLVSDINSNGFNAQQDAFNISKNVMADFRNSNNQNLLYERYAEHPEFDKLGFTPFRDNEALYNKESSTFDEIRRASGSWSTLTALGFKDVMGFGDLSDRATAAEFENAMNVGTSTKGGLGGFTTNLYLNSGYTVGIMAELAVEELAMIGAEAALGMAAIPSFGATLPGMAAIGSLMGARAAKAVKKLSNAYDATVNIGKALGNMKDASKARTFFNNAAKSTGNFLNPVENTVDFFKNRDKLGDISKLSKTAKGFGEFYKDVRNVRLAYGEGALEGGMVQNKMERELLQEFKDENGRSPNEQEAFEIRSTAAIAGRSTAMINAPVIMLSNKMTFDGLVRGRFKNLGSDIIETGLGRKILFNPKKGIKEAYQAIPKNYFKAKWQYIKNPANLLKEGGVYTKANLAEGLQEIAQETIAGTQEGYHKAKYQGDATRGGHMSFLLSSLGDQVSMQGLETFASGFLMGGMIAPVSNAVAATMQGKQTASDLKMRLTDSASWEKLQKDREAKLAEEVNILNEIYEKPEMYFNPELDNLMEQKEFQRAMKVAEENGDLKTYNDMLDASEGKHVITALKYGRLDTYIERLEDNAQLSAEEIKESFGITHEQHSKALEKRISRAKDIQKRWDTAQRKFKNPHNASEKPVAFNAWNSAVEQLVLNGHHFDRAIARQKKILESAQQVAELENVGYSDFSVLFQQEALSEETDRLKIELSLLKQGEATDSKLLKEKEVKLEKLTAFSNAISKAIVNSGGNPNEALSPEDYAAVKETYTDYLKLLAKNSKDFVNADAFDQSLNQVLDSHLLDNRSGKLNTAINTLLDPQKFIDAANRTEELFNEIHANKKVEIEKSLKAFRDLETENDLFNELLELGVFFEPKQWEELKEFGRAPDRFYHVPVDNTKRQEFDVRGETYRKALGVINDHIKLMYNIPITEAIENPSPYDEWSRKKSKAETRDLNNLTEPEKRIEKAISGKELDSILDQFDEEGITSPELLQRINLKRESFSYQDTRNYKQLAEQFGFDPEASSSKVPLPQVLEAIVNSPYADEREIALAEKMLKIAVSTEYVEFSNTEKEAGRYNATEQTVVDARYNSHNYKQGRDGNPIEHVILREEVKRRTMSSLETDVEFKNKIEGLYNQAVESFKALTEVERQLFTPGEFKGLSSPENFVQEALSNNRFQRFLATVKTDVKPNAPSGWKKFVDYIVENLARLLPGTQYDGTVLNATIGLVTAKIETTYNPQASKSAEQAEETPTAPMESGKPLTQEDLSTILTAQEALKDKDKIHVNDDIKKALAVLGYSPEEIEEYATRGRDSVRDIINTPITKAEAEFKNATKAAAESKSVAKEELEKFSKLEAQIDKALNNIKDLSTWQEADTEIQLILNTDIQFLDRKFKELLKDRSSDSILEELAQAKRDLEFNVKFTDLKVGEIVILKNRNIKAKIIKLENGVVTFRYEGLKDQRLKTMKEADVAKKIKYRWSEAFAKAEAPTTTEVTEKDKELAKETLKNATDVNSAETTKANLEAAQKKTDEERNSDVKDIFKKDCK